MTNYVAYGNATKEKYVEGERPCVTRKAREIIPTLSEPVRIRRADEYYAELDDKK